MKPYLMRYSSTSNHCQVAVHKQDLIKCTPELAYERSRNSVIVSILLSMISFMDDTTKYGFQQSTTIKENRLHSTWELS